MAPKRFLIADDTLGADLAYRVISEGIGLVWQGDFQNARQLLQALIRRLDKRPAKLDGLDYPDKFHRIRMNRAQRARTLGLLLLPVESHHHLTHRRAPDVSMACLEAYGKSDSPYLIPFTELLGVISAHEWRKKGLPITMLGANIHAHYGVFAPTRHEYLDLVAQAPLARVSVAMDIGTGTGVLALLLARRGIKRIIATDNNPRAVECAKDNVTRLELTDTIEVRTTDVLPSESADLIVCNPPWLPGKPSSPLETAIYDPDQRMLRSVLEQAAQRLTPQGEIWLILSDLAEHLRLRTRTDLLDMIASNGLTIVDRLDTRPTHRKLKDMDDPLATVRQKEVTSLWRLRPIKAQ